jgi:hypothetical protein
MKNHQLHAAIKKALLTDDLREVIAVMPSLDGLIEQFADYITLLPPATPGDPKTEPLVIACLRQAISTIKPQNGAIRASRETETAFVRALFDQSPKLLDISICFTNEEEDACQCWTPFAESIGEFVDRFPDAKVYDEPIAQRSHIGDAQARLMAVARILPVSWSECFMSAADIQALQLA